MKQNDILKLLSIFVSLNLSFYVYSDIDDLINADYSSESVTRALFVNILDDATQQAKKVVDRVKKIDNTVDDIEDDVKDLNDTIQNIEQKACNIESNIDDLIETAEIIEQKVCVSCDFIITSTDIFPNQPTFMITESGVYCLAENVTNQNPGSPIIEITAECVTLDLNDHAIEGGSGADQGILVCGARNVTIQNGIVKGAVTGIKVFGSDGPVMISNIKVTDNGDAGIVIEDSSNILVQSCNASNNDDEGFRVINSSQCIFRDCHAIENNNGDGFNIDDSTACTFDNCVAVQNSEDGFKVPAGNAKQCTFNNCFAGENRNGFFIRGEGECICNDCVSSQNQNGFQIVANSRNCFFNCTAIENTNDGFSSSSSSNNVLQFCSAQGSTDGLAIRGDSNAIRNCQAVNNAGSGFRLSGGTHYVVRDCVANNNDSFGFRMSGEDNELRGNTAIGNTGRGFIDQAKGNKFFNNTAHDNEDGNYRGNDADIELVLKPNDITGHWINVDCTATEPGEFESKICHIASLVDEIQTNG